MLKLVENASQNANSNANPGANPCTLWGETAVLEDQGFRAGYPIHHTASRKVYVMMRFAGWCSAHDCRLAWVYNSVLGHRIIPLSEFRSLMD